MLFHLINHQSVSDCFHPLLVKIIDNGIDILCVLAVSVDCSAKCLYKPQSTKSDHDNWMTMCHRLVLRKLQALEGFGSIHLVK